MSMTPPQLCVYVLAVRPRGAEDDDDDEEDDEEEQVCCSCYTFRK